MRHLDIFSGIGGFSLASDRVFGKIEHTFCDIDPFSQLVLKKHWPQSKIYNNIRDIEKETADIITGGFPCQPFSSAGRRMGTEDDRFLWPEMLRVIRLAEPSWVIGENVGGIITWNNGMVLEQVCADLESEGFEVQPIVIPAVSLNASHRRDRIWFIAHSPGNADSRRSEAISRENGRSEQHDLSESCNADRIHAGIASYAHEEGLQRWGKERMGYSGQLDRNGGDKRRSWKENWIEVASELCRVDDGIPRRMDRNPRLEALGNAIVPQVAEEIFKAIKLSMES